MTAETKTYHHGDLRAEITRIAWDQVAADGADRLSLRACARAANVDPAAVYRHFKSKDAIITALSQRAFTDLALQMEAAEAAAADKGQDQILIDIGLAYVTYATENPRLFAMMFEAAGRLPMQDIGLDTTAFTLWSAVHGLSSLFNAGLGPQTPQARQERALAVSRAVLAGCKLSLQERAV